ncbi:CbiQ family ECF transporter T component (plasmid) [Rhizobium sp. 32-5/1]|uniref:CbiQ family ECF transporter T component n=1 Tax=Rhizobium sp. 32-5/1 TaxID=3019602 RepID=UPI00240E4107|nr:CbiQ family ECF transporter T component [Rhizobium sp. 32-5/1]WEZ85926.1 CbiQ family ECF transporter T component [Rhizobium sp. 32-5/1]
MDRPSFHSSCHAGADEGWGRYLVARYFAVGPHPLLFIVTGTLAQLISVTTVNAVPTFSLVSGAGVEKALFVALRSSTCVAALLFLALTTPSPAFSNCFNVWG